MSLHPNLTVDDCFQQLQNEIRDAQDTAWKEGVRAGLRTLQRSLEEGVKGGTPLTMEFIVSLINILKNATVTNTVPLSLIKSIQPDSGCDEK
jgi:hypothetical protein